MKRYILKQAAIGLLLITLNLIMAALVQGQTSAREIVFTTSNPTACSGSRLYINRTNRSMWALVGGTCQQLDEGTGGGDALVASPLSQFAATTSAQLAGVITNETGTGVLVFSASPALTGVPVAPTAAADTNTTQIATTAYVIGQGYAKMASPTFTGTVVLPSPFTVGATSVVTSGAELNFVDGVTSSIQTQLNAKAALVSPSFTTPNIGAATGTSLTTSSDITGANFFSTGQSYFINAGGSVFWKAGAGSPEGVVTGGIGSLWSRTDGGSNTTLYRKESGTGNTGWAVVTNAGGGSGDALTTNPLSQFAATTSDQLAGVLSDETGTGGFVRATSPNLTTPTGIVKGDVGLGNVDNTSDASKPVSTAQQTALDLKANLASPTFTGTPTLPTGTVAVTQTAGNSTTAVATTAFVTTADNLKANLASPTFTGTVVIPTPFTLGATSVTTTGAELNFVAGVTSAIQTQLDAKVASTRTISTTGPLAGGGDLSANRTFSIADAAADGTTKGAASFTAADFNATSGNVSIDYTNGQAASGSTKGFLTAADWTTFNASVDQGAITSSGLTMATARLLGRSTASTGAIEEITIGSGLQLSAGVLSNTASGGTVTVVSSGSLTSTALVTGGGTTTLQTPAATATMDASGNISTPGTITSGAGGSAAGAIDLGEGTAASLVANTFSIYAPTDVAAGGLAYVLPGAAAGGMMWATNSSGVMTITHDGASQTKTFTNTTLDVEGSGNALTTVGFIEFVAAGVNGATAGPMLDVPATNGPAAAAIAGTNSLYGVLDFDAATDESIQGSLVLPDDWTGAIDFFVDWQSAATSGDVVFALQTICVANDESSDPSFNTAQTVTDTALGTANRRNVATITPVTMTGCAAGERLQFKFFRDADNGSDTMTGDARVKSLLFKLRRTQ